MSGIATAAAAAATAAILLAAPLGSPPPSLASVPPSIGSATASFPCQDVATYYKGTEGLRGEALKSRVHDIIAGHKSFSYAQV